VLRRCGEALGPRALPCLTVSLFREDGGRVHSHCDLAARQGVLLLGSAKASESKQPTDLGAGGVLLDGRLLAVGQQGRVRAS